MKPLRLPWLLGGLLAGAALQLQQPQLWPASGYLGLLALGLLLAGLAQRTRWPWVWCLVAALVMAGTTGLRARAYLGEALDPALEGQDLRLRGTIAAMPQASAWGLRFRFVPEQVLPGGQVQRLPPLIELGWYTEPGAGAALPFLQAGQQWEFNVRLKAPHGTRNPHGFDYELWQWEQGVQAVGAVRTGARVAPPQLLASSWRYPLERLRQGVRDAIVQRLLPAPDEAPGAQLRAVRSAGVVAALVTGDQRAIERGDWDLFRATGTAHLMSISGLHITLFAWLAQGLVGRLWRCSPYLCLRWPAPHAALLGGGLLAAGYALFSGWGVPAQRTVLMLACAALLRLAGRRWPWPLTWLLVCAVVVWVDPWALLQAGFWLSFIAVGILFASNTIAAHADAERARGIFYAIRGFLHEQGLMTLALMPLTLLLFGQVSLVGALANVLAIPWVTFVVTPLALLGLLAPPLWQAAAWCLGPLLLWLEWLAAWPGAVLSLPAAPLWAGLLAVLGGLCLALQWPLRVLGLPLLWPALCWQPPAPAWGEFSLLAADVGQGNAVLVRTAGHSLLYDSGPRYGPHSDAGARVLVPLLQAQGLRLDRLLLSHSDSDHTGGAQALLQAQPQAQLLGADAPGRAADQPCEAGQRWQWEGVAFELLHPLPLTPTAAPVRPNARSCVLRITSAQGVAALLVGDIERREERALLARAAPLAAQWLLVPHHGSQTSSSAEFIAAVAPRWALVQAGYRNRFGHPAAPVLARYQAAGVELVASPACGAALWSSAQPQQLDCERDSHARYWQHR